MLKALTAKNKVAFVDSSLQKPDQSDPILGVWRHWNNIVISWILKSVFRDIADSVLYLATAREIWVDLRERFRQNNALRVFQIKKHLAALQQGSMDVNSYYTQLKILWDEYKDFKPVPICFCGGMKAWMDYQHQECVMQFLMGLNESYANAKAQILMIDSLYQVGKVFALIIQDE